MPSLARKLKRSSISLSTFDNKKILHEKVVLAFAFTLAPPAGGLSDFGHYSSIVDKNVFVNTPHILDDSGK